MAAGDRLLTADGDRILEADGDHVLSDGAGDDCCCNDTGFHCWVRWRATYNCDTNEFTYEVVEVGGKMVRCLDVTPEYASGWAIEDGTCPICTWLYDQLLVGSCAIDDDCPSPPDTPDVELDNTLGCCQKVCVFSWTARVDAGGNWSGPTEAGIVCWDYENFPGELTIGSWYLVDSNTLFCEYRYNTSGDCCEDDDGCVEYPDPPELPNGGVGEPDDCGPCRRFTPCVAKVTLAGFQAWCWGRLPGGVCNNRKFDGSCDRSWYVNSSGNVNCIWDAVGIPNVKYYDGDLCTGSVVQDLQVTCIAITYDTWPKIVELLSGATTTMSVSMGGCHDNLGFDPCGVTPIFSGNQIVSWEGDCCGFPTKIVVKNNLLTDEISLGVNVLVNPDATVTLELQGCPLTCGDPSAPCDVIISGFTGGGAGFNGTYPDDIYMDQCEITSGTASFFGGLGTTAGQPNDDCSKVVWQIALVGDSIHGVWQADYNGESCPPSTGWTHVGDTGFGTPSLTISC